MVGDEGLDLACATQLPWSPGFGRLSATGARVRVLIPHSKTAYLSVDCLTMVGDEGLEPPTLSV